MLNKKLEEFNLKLPVFADNSFAYWSALQSPGWPSLYLIDREGYIRYIYLGETHTGFAQARSIEKKIQELLGESTGVPQIPLE